MRVKPEQASKGKTRMPTRHGDGEGRTNREAIDERTCSIRRGIGHGTLGERYGPSGETRGGRGSCLNAIAGWRSARESERDVVPSRPGNAGEGKVPCFRRACEEGKETVIGDEPRNAG